MLDRRRKHDSVHFTSKDTDRGQCTDVAFQGIIKHWETRRETQYNECCSNSNMYIQD